MIGVMCMDVRESGDVRYKSRDVRVRIELLLRCDRSMACAHLLALQHLREANKAKAKDALEARLC
jgi:hypothetical protein